jgi:hypothetical protein
MSKPTQLNTAGVRLRRFFCFFEAAHCKEVRDIDQRERPNHAGAASLGLWRPKSLTNGAVFAAKGSKRARIDTL